MDTLDYFGIILSVVAVLSFGTMFIIMVIKAARKPKKRDQNRPASRQGELDFSSPSAT